MQSQSSPSSKIVLTDDQGLGKIQVDLEAFFELSFWMAEELLDLTAKWAPLAAPKDKEPQASR